MVSVHDCLAQQRVLAEKHVAKEASRLIVAKKQRQKKSPGPQCLSAGLIPSDLLPSHRSHFLCVLYFPTVLQNGNQASSVWSSWSFQTLKISIQLEMKSNTE